METNFKKRNNGITLVALVITIILLLILAGISIATLTGSGLFEKAKLAKEQSEERQKEEQQILGDYENKMAEYINGTRNSNANKYSTNEVEIGNWIDGKKLYRKTVVFDKKIENSQGTIFSLEELIPNYDYICIDRDHSYAIMSGSILQPSFSPPSEASKWSFAALVESRGLIIYVGSEAYKDFTLKVVTFEYTKK